MAEPENHFFGIGMRSIKTALAVFICVIIFNQIEGITPFYAGIAAALSMRDTYENSIKYGKARMLGTLIGGLVGIIYLMFINPEDTSAIHMYFVPVLIIIAIRIVNIFGKNDAASSIACIVVMAVTMNHFKNSEKYFYAFSRIMETFVGIFVAIIINKFLFPYKKK